MANPFSIEVQGLDKLLKGLDEKTKQMTIGIDGELGRAATDIEAGAKRRVPVDMGGLKNTIGHKKNATLSWEVVAQSKYAAYVEFGTGDKTVLPPGFQEYASQFQGKTGESFKQFVDRLTEWVIRKQLVGTYSLKTHKRTDSGKRKADQNAYARSIAFLIARHILKYGGKPHPFMFPSVSEQTPIMLENIKKVLAS